MLLQTNGTMYREQLRFYQHAPRGVQESFARLRQAVASLTAGMASASDEETFTPLPRIPQPPPLAPDVEMNN